MKKTKKILTTNMLHSYFKFLIRNELIFFSKSPNLFPKLDFSTWEQHSDFYQVLIDIDFNSDIDLINSKLFHSLNRLNCKYLELRIFYRIPLEQLYKIISLIENTTIIGVNVYYPYHTKRKVIDLIKEASNYPRINNIFIYNITSQKSLPIQENQNLFNIHYKKNKLKGCTNCGVVSSKYFTINPASFAKANSKNSCLQGKVGIDVKGNIKNCPSMRKSFGNLKDNDVELAVKNKHFKKYWEITKNEITGCKDCEFRYICLDCRAYVEDPEDIKSKPLKCGYDPYTGIWEEWSTNPLKQKIMNNYKLIDGH